MIYFDTSFIAPLILPESTSSKVEFFMHSVTQNKLGVSHWTRVEFASLLARRRRMNELDELQSVQAMNQFERLLMRSFLTLEPSTDDFNLAINLLQHPTGLRSGDALHLAIASNHKADVFYTLDKKLIDAASALGISISMGINL